IHMLHCDAYYGRRGTEFAILGNVRERICPIISNGRGISQIGRRAAQRAVAWTADYAVHERIPIWVRAAQRHGHLLILKRLNALGIGHRSMIHMLYRNAGRGWNRTNFAVICDVSERIRAIEPWFRRIIQIGRRAAERALCRTGHYTECQSISILVLATQHDWQSLVLQHLQVLALRRRWDIGWHDLISNSVGTVTLKTLLIVGRDVKDIGGSVDQP